MVSDGGDGQATPRVAVRVGLCVVTSGVLGGGGQSILLVNVPCNILSKVVTVECGNCNTILSVNMMKACLLPFQFFFSTQPARRKQDEDEDEDSIQFSKIIHKPPNKKQRALSSYNCFIREEIKRLKIEHPNLTHKQAFSAASKNWAHFPQSVEYRGGEADLAIFEK
ncbi:plant-specific transcription factor YABBY family protein [Striga asiatica]|uniref:Plant-specific transcription factor YABBY family protein n=1 Tax=Striga asiatica TaxID=4170 RepID=A0A5A7PHT6_STRAF|nr:plant-specific transcription factor YABBY family protein [Striga asiatica]